MASINQIVLYKDDVDYPCVHLDDSINLPGWERESFVDWDADGTNPMRARVWMTDKQIDALPDDIARGSAPCGIKMSGDAIDPTAPANTPKEHTLQFAQVFYILTKQVARAGTDVMVYEVLLASEQWWWHYKFHNKQYNILSGDRTEFVLGATNSSTAKTLQEIITDIETTLEMDDLLTIPAEVSTDPPFNVLSSGPAGLLLGRLLQPYGLYLHSNPFGPTIFYTLFAWDYTLPNSISLRKVTETAGIEGTKKDDPLLEAFGVQIPETHGGHAGRRLVPATVQVAFPKYPPIYAKGTNYRSFYENNPEPGIGEGEEFIWVGDHFQFTDPALSKTYTEDLFKIAQNRADGFWRRALLPDNVWIFAGVLDFLSHVASIRRTRWSMDLDGARTTVWEHSRLENPRQDWEDRFNAMKTAQWPEHDNLVGPLILPRDDGTLDIHHSLVYEAQRARVSDDQTYEPVESVNASSSSSSTSSSSTSSSSSSFDCDCPPGTTKIDVVTDVECVGNDIVITKKTICAIDCI